MVAILHLFAFLGRCFLVTQRHGEYAGTVFYQVLDHRQVIAGGGTVQRGPVQEIEISN